ncbi:hypothetical protein FALBO_3644 [Fusarium albosuccineum]|uniref:Apple domain-containing protein n=1 Tax=Fusarium albosuccineum TaxID=1237068 RepID=A0A8H4LJT0_9HYPO|nr:hypothetical protein FALBO_3644 [Fusarium albosuccineum]
MKFLGFTLLAGLATSSPITSRCTSTTACQLTGFNGVVTPDTTNSRIDAILGIKDAEVCRAKCYSTEYPSCKAFAIRSSGSGACLLWDKEISPRALKPGETSTYWYYTLPAGIREWVPENVAQHYKADTSKTKGNYKDCRGLCLSEPQCKGFGFKEGGNCQLYDVSLAGKVKAKEDSPYVQYQVDCTAVQYGTPVA